MSRYLEFDTKEKVFKIQKLNLDRTRIYNDREVCSHTYKESDYFNIISPHLNNFRRTK